MRTTLGQRLLRGVPQLTVWFVATAFVVAAERFFGWMFMRFWVSGPTPFAVYHGALAAPRFLYCGAIAFVLARNFPHWVNLWWVVILYSVRVLKLNYDAIFNYGHLILLAIASAGVVGAVAGHLAGTWVRSRRMDRNASPRSVIARMWPDDVALGTVPVSPAPSSTRGARWARPTLAVVACVVAGVLLLLALEELRRVVYALLPVSSLWGQIVISFLFVAAGISISGAGVVMFGLRSIVPAAAVGAVLFVLQAPRGAGVLSSGFVSDVISTGAQAVIGGVLGLVGAAVAVHVRGAQVVSGRRSCNTPAESCSTGARRQGRKDTARAAPNSGNASR